MIENLARLDLWGEYAVKIFITMLLSGAIGLERQISRKTAGLRTHLLVNLGALMFTLVGLNLLEQRGDSQNLDVMRVVDAMIGGLGFLGAGAIIQSRGDVQGMTTATSIWTMGALGVAVAIDNYVLAVLFTLVSLLVLTWIDRLEDRYIKKNKGREKEDEPKTEHQSS